jgi:hypothetical protein
MQRAGGRALPASEFLPGHPFVGGEVIASCPMPALVSATPFPRPGRA